MGNSILELEKSLSQLNSTFQGRRLFIQSLPFLLAGCATTGKGRLREGNNSGQLNSFSVEQEQQMTREYLPQMKKEYPSFKNSFAQSYIAGLGNKIVSANNLDGRPYQYNFTLVNSKQINAFALPAGEVFVTSGLVRATASEAELAGVVGHEIGHIQARHAAERISEEKKNKTKNLLFAAGGALLGGAAGYALGKKLCSKNDRECLRRVAFYGAAAGGAGTLLIQKFGFMANSREDEMEADRIGFKTALRAGYDKDKIGLFYNKLLKMEQNHKKGSNITTAFADALSTHPPSIDRVRQMKSMANQSTSGSGIITTNDFSRLKRMV